MPDTLPLSFVKKSGIDREFEEKGRIMKKKHLCWLTAVALAGGILGGFISDRVFNSRVSAAPTGDGGTGQSIAAREFRVVDAQGKLTGVLDAMGLRLMQDKMLALFNAAGMLVYETVGSEKNKLRIEIIVEEAKGKTELYSTPVIELYDKVSVSPRLKMTLDESEEPSIRLQDSNAIPRVLIGEGRRVNGEPKTNKSSRPHAIQLINDKGHAVWSAP